MAIYSNLTMDQGSTFNATVDVTDVDNNVLVLTGYSVAGQMRKSYDSVNAINFTCEIQNAQLGQVAISLTATQTNAIAAGRYVYDVEITSGAGTVTRIIQGQIEVTPGVTR